MDSRLHIYGSPGACSSSQGENTLLHPSSENEDYCSPPGQFTTSYLNREGRTRSAALNRLTLDILRFCQNHCITFIPSYFSGVANLGVDALSRGQVSMEWFLNPRVVEKIFKKLGRPEVDLFASRRSAHLLLSGEERQEVSRIQCPGSGLEFQEDVCFLENSPHLS